MFQEMINNIDFSRFIDNLGYMGAGMLGIFIVIGLIVIATVILNKITSPGKNRKK